MRSDKEKLDHYRVRFRLGLLTGIFQLILFLFTLIKWAFSPIALLFQLLVFVPIAKNLYISIDRSRFEPIDESRLPDDVWIHFRQLIAKFSLLGFRPGAIVHMNEAMPNQRSYNQILINPHISTAMGINAVQGFDKKGNIVIEKNFQELTAVCPDGGYVDFTNILEDEPIAPKSRLRVQLPEEDEIALFKLFREYTNKMGCTLTASMLTKLERETADFFYHEYHDGVMEAVAKGYLKTGDKPHQLAVTWRGALIAAFLGNWPLAVVARLRRERENQALLQAAGIDRERIDAYNMTDLLPPLPWVDEAALDLNRLTQMLSPIIQGFSPELHLLSVEYFFDTESDRLPSNIHMEYSLYERFTERNLVRFATLYLSIDPQAGRIEDLIIDDDHTSMDQIGETSHSYFDTSLPDTETLIPPRKAMQIGKAALPEIPPEGITDLSLTLAQAEQRSVWSYTFFTQNGKPQGVTLDAVSGTAIQQA